MFDRALALSIVEQIAEALEKIKMRVAFIKDAEDFTATDEGAEKLDSICMQFMAIGEALKNLDKVTNGTLLAMYPEIDWKGAMGFRDIIAHHYFDVDAEQVFWICGHQVLPLASMINKISSELRTQG